MLAPQPIKHAEARRGIDVTVPASADFGKAHLQAAEFTVDQRTQEVVGIIADPRRGQVSELAKRHSISRQSASRLVNQGRRALAATFAPKAAGRPARSQTLTVDRERIEASVVSLAIDGHATNAGTQACMETIMDLHLSTGTISGILKECGQRAQRVLRALPMPAQAVHVAADEIYDHDQPILTVMDDETQAIFLMAEESVVDGTTWGVHLLELMDRDLQCEGITTDQGSAMRIGIAEAGFVPVGSHCSDTFHVLYGLGGGVRTLHKQARHAKANLENITAALDAQTRPRRGPGRPRKPATLQAYDQATAAAEAARQRGQAGLYLYRDVRDALNPVDTDGQLIPEALARATVAAAAELFREIGGQAIPLADLLEGAQAQVHVFRARFEQTYQDLVRRYGADLVAFVGWAWFHHRALHVLLPTSEERLRTDWGLQVPLAAVAEIWHCLRNSHRSSSINEGFNSHLRTDIQVHRGLTTSLLPLIAFRQNVRTFRRGVHRGQAPFVALGILPASSLPWARQLFALSASLAVPALPAPSLPLDELPPDPTTPDAGHPMVAA